MPVKRFFMGSPHLRFIFSGCLAAFTSVFLLSGCDREGITTYTIPKEVPPAQTAAHSEHDGHNHGPAQPGISWTTPVGWEEQPAGQMRAATFRVTDAGKTVDVGIVPLPGQAGTDLDNVNRWRGQVGLPPISEEEMQRLAIPVTIAGVQCRMFDQAGENAASGDKTRILAAILRKDGVAWFFKATGDDELVARNRKPFMGFLESIQFGQRSALPADHPSVGNQSVEGSGAAASSASGRPEWEIPKGWQEIPGGQFLVAKFTVSGDQATAVNVSTSAGDGGGLAGNVNRWRKQIGLADLSPADLEKSVTELETPHGKISLVDMSGTDVRTGQPVRTVGAMLRVGDQAWFYKLMGPADKVEREKQVFIQFIQSAKYPHAR